MTDIGELVLRIKADATALQSALKDANNAVKDTTHVMGGALDSLKEQFKELIPVITVGTIVEFTKGALEAADNIYIMSQRTGIAADTLSKLNIPLKQNGSSVDEFAASMKFLSRNIELAGEGNVMLIKRFDDLGLSVTRLKSLTPEEQFFAVANALSGISDQSRLSADNLTLMGRGAQGLLPIIKQANGDMEGFLKTQKDFLSPEQIAEVHELDDKWIAFFEHLKIGAVEASLAIIHLAESQRQLRNEDTLSGVGGDTKPSPGKGAVSYDRPNSVTMAAYMGKEQYGPAYNPNAKDKSGRGNNNDLTAAATTPAAEDNGMTIDDYIDKLNQEAAALAKGKEAYAQYKAEVAAASATGQEWSDLTQKDKDSIDAAALALDKQKQAQEELTKQKEKDIQVQAQMEHEISSSLANIALNYKSLGQTVSDTLKKIAQQIIEQQITSPLSSSLGTLLTGSKTITGAAGGSNSLFSGLFSFLPHFAGGGDVSGGNPIVVGENGPELFVPGGNGSIIPNGGKMGGGGATVVQNINLSPGLAETVNAAIMNAAPSIAAMAHAGVMQAIQKGGAESRIVGKRS